MNLREIGALSAPHGGRAHAQEDGGGDEGVELRVEHGGDVDGVGEHAEDHDPLDGEELDGGGGQEHAGQHHGGVDHAEGPRAQAVNLKGKCGKLFLVQAVHRKGK